MSQPIHHHHAPQSHHPEANDKQFESFLNMIKNSEFDQVRNFLKHYNNQVLKRLELSFRQPALYFAIIHGSDSNSCEMMKILIQHGADPKYKDQNDQTIFFYGCRDGKLACCKLLVENGMDIEQQDMYGQTPLFYAASENRINLLELFQNKGNAICHINEDYINHVDKLASQTALYYAARKGHTEMCKQLIEKGANPSHLDSQNKTAAEYAKKARHNQTADLINYQIKRQKQPIIKQSAQISVNRGQQSQFSDKRRKKQAGSSIVSQVPRATYKIVFMNQKGEAKDLTQQQVRTLVKNNPTLQTYLTNPSSIPIQQLDRMQKTQTWQKAATKLLQIVMKQKGAFWFQEPVDPVKFNIMDYFDIIEKPMDLGTIKKKLSHNAYRSVAHFVEDMNLIWNNCYKYNGDQHQISKTAKELQNFFIQEYQKSGLDAMVSQ